MTLKDFAVKAKDMKIASGLSMREISTLMGNPGQQAQVQRIVDVQRHHNITINTFLKFADVCSYRIVVMASPKKRRRGREA